MPYAPRGMPPAIDLPTTSRSGSRFQWAVSPPGPDTSVCVLSTMRARLRHQPAQAGVKPIRGPDHTGVGDRRLGQYAGDVTAGKLPLDGLKVVVLDQPHMPRGVWRNTQALGDHALGLELAQQLIGMPVILPVEHQHRGATGECSATRIASVLACVDDNVNCHVGSPKRRASSLATSIPS
jgi:hypothetical protein